MVMKKVSFPFSNKLSSIIGHFMGCRISIISVATDIQMRNYIFNVLNNKDACT